ncbi:MAG: hypothetical protein FWD25_04200 [Clostridia bacterium]|nr:hypothetical protein [Clostridia bacterium]
MYQPSPYTLLREANGLVAPARTDLLESAWTDQHTLAARWQDLLQPSPKAATPAPLPADGPAMRTPPPMHPPIAYPTTTQVYDASTAPSRPRHPHYDSIIEQHKNAAEKAVYVPAALE